MPKTLPLHYFLKNGDTAGWLLPFISANHYVIIEKINLRIELQENHMKEADTMNWMLILYMIILAALSLFTGEVVTFIMLGFILIALNNIHKTLKQIAAKDHT